MTSNLRGQIPDAVPDLDILPLFHTCDGHTFRNIMFSGYLEAEEQPKYDMERLLFFFYGKPSFRVPHKGSLSLNSYLPCCLIYGHEKIGEPAEISPFDTGAFKDGKLRDLLHPKMELKNFSLGNKLEDVLRYIDYFFGNNTLYFEGKVRPPPNDISALDFEAQHLFEVLRGQSGSDVDDRASTVEFQLDRRVRVGENFVDAIIIPQSFMDDPNVRAFAEKNNSTTFLLYKTYRGNVREYHSQIRDLAFEHISSYLQE